MKNSKLELKELWVEVKDKMKKLALIATIFVMLAVLLVTMPARGADPTWTQSTDADFNLGTKSYVTVSSGVTITVAVPERSFETVTGWTYAEVDTNNTLSGAQSADTATGWPSNGSYSYKIVNTATGGNKIQANEYGEVNRSVDLTNVGTLYFDWRLVSSFANEFTAQVLVNSTVVWSQVLPTTATNYLNRSADVSTYSGTYTVRFRVTNTSGGASGRTFTGYVDNIQPGYYSSGNLTSSSNDAGANYNADWGTLTWAATTNGNTAVKFQIATNKDNATWNFVGTDGTSGTYYTTNGTSIWVGHDGDRYIKYKAYLSTTDNISTPTLSSVSITYDQISWASYKTNYGSLGGTANDVFDEYPAENTVYMEGTGFTTGTSYKVIYWYYDAAWYKRFTDSGVVAASGGTLQNFYTFSPSDVAGNWQASVYYPSSSDPASYSATDDNLVANDISYSTQYSFNVDAAAIPEFSTVMAAIAVAGLCFGIYYWMRRRRLESYKVTG